MEKRQILNSRFRQERNPEMHESRISKISSSYLVPIIIGKYAINNPKGENISAKLKVKLMLIFPDFRLKGG